MSLADLYTRRNERRLFGMCFLLLLVYTVLRASSVSIVYDESETYFNFVTKDAAYIKGYYFATANNHMLNSLAARKVLQYLPLSPLTLRLPNVLAHILYMLSSWALLYKLRRGQRLAAWLVLNLNPFVLDFFCLARGYGLSAGFVMTGLLGLRLFLERPLRLPDLVLALGCGMLATLASFSTLNVYLGFTGIIAGFIFYRFVRQVAGLEPRCWFSLLAQAAFTAWISYRLLHYLLPVLFRLKEADQFYFGGDSGFWSDTVGSLTRCFLYEAPYEFVAGYFVKGLLLLTLAAVPVLLWLRRKEKPFFLAALWLLVLGCALSTVIQHARYDNKFLIERTALFFVPLFLALLAEALWHTLTLLKGMRWTLPALAALSLIHFAWNASLNYVLIWKDDGGHVLTWMESRIHQQKPGGVRITTDWLHASSLHFYQATGHYTWLGKIETESDKPAYTAPYAYLGEERIADYTEHGYKLLQKFPESRTYLYVKEP